MATSWRTIRNREIGFVFQTFNLLPAHQLAQCRTAADLCGIDPETREERAAQALGDVGFGDRMHHKPNELSGGQRQRVAIARALVNEPSIILADEPTGNLDSKTGDEIMELLENLYQRGNTIILVTHEADIAVHARRTVHLRDGLIESATDWDLFFPSSGIWPVAGVIRHEAVSLRTERKLENRGRANAIESDAFDAHGARSHYWDYCRDIDGHRRERDIHRIR